MNMEWDKPFVIALVVAVFAVICSIVQAAYFISALKDVTDKFEARMAMLKTPSPVTPLSCPACPACPPGIPEAVFKQVMQGMAKEAIEIRNQLKEVIEKLPQQKPGRRGELPTEKAPDTKSGYRATSGVSRGNSGAKQKASSGSADAER